MLILFTVCAGATHSLCLCFLQFVLVLFTVCAGVVHSLCCCCLQLNKGCFINRVCYEKDAKNPSDECQVCDPAKNRDKWTQSQGT